MMQVGKRRARSGDVHVACHVAGQVVGHGPADPAFISDFISTLEINGMQVDENHGPS